MPRKQVILSVVLCIAFSLAVTKAADKKELPKLYVALGNGRHVHLKTKSPIVTAKATEPKVARVLLDEKDNIVVAYLKQGGGTFTMRIGGHGLADPTCIYVKGEGLGSSQLSLEGADGTTEIMEIVVRNELVLPVGGSHQLALSSNKPIRAVVNKAEKIALVRPVLEGPMSVAVEAREAGEATINLVDNEGKSETFIVFVRKVGKMLAVGEKVRIQMAKKPLITHARSEDRRIVRILPIKDDPTALEIVGIAPGAAQISLTDDKGNTETLEVGVKPKEK